MSIFDLNKKKRGQTEFVKDPLAFIRFLREEDEKDVEFGQTALIAAGEEVIGPLIELLTNEQEEKTVRRRVGTVLSRIGKPAIAPLIEALKKQSLSTRSSAETLGMAAAVLSGIGKQAVDPLIGALDSDSRQVRYAAAIALVQTGEADAVDAVRDAVKNGQPGDREMFKMVLGQK